MSEYRLPEPVIATPHYSLSSDEYYTATQMHAAYQAGAASRDAEVAGLKTVPMKYRRMAFNAELQKLNMDLLTEVEALRADAARYQFWRNRYPETFKPTDLTPEDVDRLSDKAIAAEGKTP